MKAQQLPPREASKQFYGRYLPRLQNAESAFVQLLMERMQSTALAGKRFGMEHYKTRIKSPESAKAKLAKLGLAQTADAAAEHLFDLVGARVVCQFIDDIYVFQESLATAEGVELVQVEDYIQSPKPNGYRSLHLILRLPVQTPEGACSQCVEVQARTIAMDFWASLEHELKYKKNVRDAELMYAELKRCAEEIASVDLSMQVIREWLE